MTGIIESWFLWLENTAIAIEIRQSLWLYPVIQFFHIAGIVFLVGSIMIFDLRLLGVARRLDADILGRSMVRISKAGFLITILSGFLLFIAHATDWAENPLFWIKILLIIIAVLNAVFFNKLILNRIHRWETYGNLPLRVRASGVVSLLLWFIIIAAGRFLAYY